MELFCIIEGTTKYPLINQINQNNYSDCCSYFHLPHPWLCTHWSTYQQWSLIVTHYRDRCYLKINQISTSKHHCTWITVAYKYHKWFPNFEIKLLLYQLQHFKRFSSFILILTKQVRQEGFWDSIGQELHRPIDITSNFMASFQNW